MIIVDFETDGLLDTLTKVHCMVAYNTITDKYMSIDCTQKDYISRIIDFLTICPEISCHNGIEFDLQILKKLYNYEYKGKYFDTLLGSRILWPDIDMAKYSDELSKIKSVKNPHSIESWGIRFGISKPKHEDWTKFSPEMLHRCKEDVRIQTQLYLKIQEKIKELQAINKHIDLQLTFSIEHETWNLIEKQCAYGWYFDDKLAFDLVEELTNTINIIENQLIPKLPMQLEQPYDVPCKAFKANGQITKFAAEWVKEKQYQVYGDFSRIKIEKFNLRSSNQLKVYLLSKGWEPEEYNFKKDKHNKAVKDKYHKQINTSAKLPDTIEKWETVAREIGDETITLIAEHHKAAHRRSQIQGLIKNMNLTDHRIHGKVIACGTNTARMRHSVIVNIPKAKLNVYYGKQMRSLFTCPDDKVLLGIDAKALEARCEAHYVYPFDKEAALELIDGDIHTHNSKLFETDREHAKSGKYAILYGCSAGKLARTLNKPNSFAKKLYDNYWDGNPGLKKLKLLVEQTYDNNGFLKGIDGRPLFIRYKHALLNTLFQSCGSIIMKLAYNLLDKSLKQAILNYRYLGFFHDEFIIEADPKDVEQIKELALKAMLESGKQLTINVPIEGDVKIGRTWADIH